MLLLISMKRMWLSVLDSLIRAVEWPLCLMHLFANKMLYIDRARMWMSALTNITSTTFMLVS